MTDHNKPADRQADRALDRAGDQHQRQEDRQHDREREQQQRRDGRPEVQPHRDSQGPSASSARDRMSQAEYDALSPAERERIRVEDVNRGLPAHTPDAFIDPTTAPERGGPNPQPYPGTPLDLGAGRDDLRKAMDLLGELQAVMTRINERIRRS